VTDQSDAALYDELRQVAKDAAAAAVELIHTNRPESFAVDEKSSATDHVTEMDTASERLIRSVIAAARPTDLVIGEEDQPGRQRPARPGETTGGTAGVTWWVDPIDGTTNYVYDHPGYNVSIAAEIDGTVVAAVVADPTHDRVYSATLGGGAFCDDRRLRLTARTEAAESILATALVATGFGYSSERRARQGQVVAQLLPQIRDIRRMGAAALDLCSVASGRVDAYYEVGLAMWDLAAGELIATEAGARVGTIEGGPDRPTSVLAAHPALFDPLQAVLSTLGAGQV